jgi:hypothetical protein
MPGQVDFSVYFSSPELLADKFRELCFHGRPTVYPIDPFQILISNSVIFQDYKARDFLEVF